MCGITGYLGKSNAVSIILSSLKRLEYRGYDSAGVAILSNNMIVEKDVGRIYSLEKKPEVLAIEGTVGIGHTRWATHGKPSQENAHPHTDCSGDIAVVHNGIIENFDVLKEMLLDKNHLFESETDTEVIAHLIEHNFDSDLKTAVMNTLDSLRGNYALAVISRKEPDKIIVARKGSPLVVGIGEDEYFVGSDVTAFLDFTRNVIFLNDDEVAELTPDGVTLLNRISGQKINRDPIQIHWTSEMAEKGGFQHFMLKEIHEQPKAIMDTLTTKKNIDEVAKQLSSAEKIYLVACGTSYHAGLVAKNLIENLAQVSVEVIVASEFSSSTINVINEKHAIISISQSGETSDTLTAIRLAKKKEVKIFAITNVVGSTITRESDGFLYTHAGPEIGVAATKTFTTQILVVTQLALALAKIKNTISKEKLQILYDEMEILPRLVEEVIETHRQEISKIARTLHTVEDFYYLGRGPGLSIALEGALKLKELSYIHGEGMAGGELKHGTLALIEDDIPVVGVVLKDDSYERMIGSLMEVKARGAMVITVGEEKDDRIATISTLHIGIPEIDPLLAPIPYVIPLQIFAYDVAVMRGCDPDKPRNLAKSVTVE